MLVVLCYLAARSINHLDIASKGNAPKALWNKSWFMISKEGWNRIISPRYDWHTIRDYEKHYFCMISFKKKIKNNEL